MSRLTKMDWRAWLRSIGSAHARHSTEDTHGEQTAADRRDGQNPAERLERIAIYARAGYFNMGYTSDMTQIPFEIRPD